MATQEYMVKQEHDAAIIRARYAQADRELKAQGLQTARGVIHPDGRYVQTSVGQVYAIPIKKVSKQ